MSQKTARWTTLRTPSVRLKTRFSAYNCTEYIFASSQYVRRSVWVLIAMITNNVISCTYSAWQNTCGVYTSCLVEKRIFGSELLPTGLWVTDKLSVSFSIVYSDLTNIVPIKSNCKTSQTLVCRRSEIRWIPTGTFSVQLTLHSTTVEAATPSSRDIHSESLPHSE